MSEKKKVRKLTVLDSKNNMVELSFFECDHCSQLIPEVGSCQDCGTEYVHVRTVENFKTEFIHYIYECSGCPEAKRLAQKIIKFSEGAEKETPQVSKESRRKELADDFLRSGGY